jgi:hypothetical protein
VSLVERNHHSLMLFVVFCCNLDHEFLIKIRFYVTLQCDTVDYVLLVIEWGV